MRIKTFVKLNLRTRGHPEIFLVTVYSILIEVYGYIVVLSKILHTFNKVHIQVACTSVKKNKRESPFLEKFIVSPSTCFVNNRNALHHKGLKLLKC